MSKEILKKAEYIEECLQDEDSWSDADGFKNFIFTEIYQLLKLIKNK